MASTSTSSLQKSFKYDVFLSFRGEDTRKNFVDHLYHALTQRGIETYKDDEKIKKGNMINDELIEAIEDSKFYIIIFSKNYASSSWCLEELVKIMECQTMDDHTAYPVFYDVEPTEVRKQTGAVGDAFAKHKEDEAERKWREALKDASDLAGFELKSMANGHEAKFIQKIVEEISLELRFINSSIDGDLIGMETRVNEVISFLEPGVDDVRMLGIWGMGGAGKTTLARAVFDRISFQFEGKSFVENVREESKPSLSDLKSLQKQVLSDILNDQSVTVSGVLDGKSKMKKTMCGRKVLVVLDDVHHKDQLEALAGDCNWFKPGSRVIITTRDEQVLVAHRVCLIHNVTLLTQAEASCLFSRYAFGREIPVQGYEELTGNVLNYAGGLPLTIKVMGSFLCGQDESVWKDAIKRLKTIPLTETMDRLEISFNGLEQEHKEIFLDVACILKGRAKEDAIIVLESCGFHAEVGLRVLEQKSLITIAAYGSYLGMHDHLEEMGRNIVRRLHPDEPNNHSRLWIAKEIDYILTKDLGTQTTKCIRLVAESIDESAMKRLANMKDLRLIDIKTTSRHKNWKFDEVSQYFPSALRYLRWYYFPFSSLPNTFQGKNLVGLEMLGSNIVQLWEDGVEKVLNNLRFFSIRHSKLRTFDLRVAPNLERLTIFRCDDFVELSTPTPHQKLKYLDLSFLKLTTLHLGAIPNLKALIFEHCEYLVELQMPIESLKLEELYLSYSNLKTIHLGNTPKLERLLLRDCKEWVELQMPFQNLKLKHLDLSHSKLKTIHPRNTPNLETLILNECIHDWVELQMPFENIKLRDLNLTYSKLKSIHLGNTPNLETLILQGCNDLVELHMPVESLKLGYLMLTCSKLKTIHLGNTPNLVKMIVSHCNDLVELQMPVENLQLIYLSLHCPKLKTFHLGNTPNLESFILAGCNELVELQMPVESIKIEELKLTCSKLMTIRLGNSPNLKKLILDGCNDLVELQMPVESLKLEELTITCSKLMTIRLGNTPSLKSLILDGCNDLVELQMPAEGLKLENLKLTSSKLKTIHLGNTPNLKFLLLEKCNDLAGLQMLVESLNLGYLHVSHSQLKTFHLGNTPKLRALVLEGCKDLVELQIPVESLKLEHLELTHSKLKTIHLGNTPNLERLILRECNDLVELQMPVESLKLFELTHSKLKTIHLGNTPNLERLILQECNDLVELQMPVENLKLKELNISNSKLKTIHLGNIPNLERLILEGCNDLVELQMPTENLELKILKLSHSKLKTIHLGSTPKLRKLILKGCNDLEVLHILDNLKLEELNLSHSKLRIVDLGLTPNLKRLNLENCYCLVEISAPVGCLRNLGFLDLSGCGSFKSFLFDKQLDSYEVGSLSELHLITESANACPLHSNNDSPKVQFVCYYKHDPASSFGNLETLISIGLCACTNLESFTRRICSLRGLRKLTLEGIFPEVSRNIDRLECLEELIFSSTNTRNLPDSICKLKHLKSFKIISCWLLEKLPDNIGRLESLETLILTDCKLLRDIPNSICRMKCIKYFHLPGCILVEKLPRKIGLLQCLKELNIEGTSVARLPLSIFHLKGLRIIGSRRLFDSCGLTPKLRRTSGGINEIFCYI